MPETQTDTPLDLTTPLKQDLSADSNLLFASFSGLTSRPDYLPFDFVNATQAYPIKKLFFRDPHRLWYTKGLPGISPNLEGIATFIQEFQQAEQIEHSVFFGVSASGFAAILFGVLCRASEVHVFSSKTFHTPLLRFLALDLHLRPMLHGDFRHWQRLWRIQFEPGIQKQYLDLKKVIRERKSQVRIHLHYCEHTRLDRVHALRLAELPNVTLHAYPEGGHMLARHLRDQGRLQPILDQALTQFLPDRALPTSAETVRLMTRANPDAPIAYA